MAITVAVAGYAGSYGSAGASIATAAYNQSAGHCLVVAINGYHNATTPLQTPSDTAGNSWTKVFASDVVPGDGRTWWTNFWYAPNCTGNANNIITETFSASPTYASMNAWDISGVGLVTPLDIAQHADATSLTTAALGPFSTNFANEAIIGYLVYNYGEMTACTQPSGFTENAEGITDFISCGAYEVVSAIQTNITPTWTGIAGQGVGSNYPMSFVLSFAASSGVPNSLMLMGSGT
jgi:hypothetical protein